MTQIITLCDVVVNTHRARPAARSVNQYVMDFAKTLKKLRTAAGLSQEELAHALGYPGQSRISNYERGERTPSLDELPAIAGALGVEIAQLLGAISSGPVSQPVRLDPEIVRDVARALHEVYRDELGKTYSLIEEPELFAELYERTVARGHVEDRSNLVWLGARIKGTAQLGAPLDERSKGIHGQGHAQGSTRSGRKKA